jgi:hypothetical protein
MTPEQRRAEEWLQLLSWGLLPSGRGCPHRERALVLGDWVRLKNGVSPEMLVVDAWPRSACVMVGYRCGESYKEWALPRDELKVVRKAR